MGDNEGEHDWGDYSNEGRNSTPTGTPGGGTQSPGGGWMCDDQKISNTIHLRLLCFHQSKVSAYAHAFLAK